jgi:predicted HNH restriction endonuclease
VFTADDDDAIEGRLLVKAHRLRERNKSIIKKRKSAMRQELGKLRCEVCDLTEHESADRFGASARDIFECHHRVPLQNLDGTRTTRVSDLAVLCPTCHAAIHKFNPLVSVEQLRKKVAGATALETREAD